MPIKFNPVQSDIPGSLEGNTGIALNAAKSKLKTYWV
jgi:hypothetical protein